MIVFFSCKNEFDDTIQEQLPLNATKSEILTSLDLRRTSFQSLTPVGKSEVMESHLLYCRDSLNLTNDQIAIIDVALNIVCEDLYANENYLEEHTNYNDFKIGTDNFFNEGLLRVLVFSDILNTNDLDGYRESLHNRPIKCSCSKEDDWCNFLSPNTGSCGGICEKTIGGCGTLWAKSCTGYCMLYR